MSGRVDQDMAKAIRLMCEKKGPQLVVLDEEGLVGLVLRENLARERDSRTVA